MTPATSHPNPMWTHRFIKIKQSLVVALIGLFVGYAYAINTLQVAQRKDLFQLPLWEIGVGFVLGVAAFFVAWTERHQSSPKVLSLREIIYIVASGLVGSFIAGAFAPTVFPDPSDATIIALMAIGGGLGSLLIQFGARFFGGKQ